MTCARALAQGWLRLRRSSRSTVVLLVVVAASASLLVRQAVRAPQPASAAGVRMHAGRLARRSAGDEPGGDAQRVAVPAAAVSDSDFRVADRRLDAALLKADALLRRTTAAAGVSTTLSREELLARKNLTAAEEKRERDFGFQRNRFQQFVSDRLSLHRPIRDPRSHFCRELHATLERDVALLPKTSVIIVFHNEARSTLLRTVWSVLDRSPTRLIHEIILVDDASTFDHLGAPLTEELATIPKTRLIRLPTRSGLIRAKVAGAGNATGEVLTFLDSHCECNVGWLEPLLDRIRVNRSNVAVPTIDSIDKETFEYKGGRETVTRGVFSWTLTFTWLDLPAEEQKRRESPAMPLPSPTMAGGLFSIDRAYFYEIGAYDLGMDIWGGENLEMSFRIWQCGGRIEILPCSRVGHVFRDHHPYKFPGASPSTVIARNLNRVADVWMDEYKEIYYDLRPHNRRIPLGNISDRVDLRRKLQCRSFRWYLDNVYPDMFVPLRENVVGAGAVRNLASHHCLDITSARAENMKLRLVPCSPTKTPNRQTSEFYMWPKKAQLRIETDFSARCVDSSERGENKPVGLYPCHGQRGNQEFRWTPKLQIQHVGTGACLTALKRGAQWTPVMAECKHVGDANHSASPLQRWTFSKWHNY